MDYFLIYLSFSVKIMWFFHFFCSFFKDIFFQDYFSIICLFYLLCFLVNLYVLFFLFHREIYNTYMTDKKTKGLFYIFYKISLLKILLQFFLTAKPFQLPYLTTRTARQISPIFVFVIFSAAKEKFPVYNIQFSQTRTFPFSLSQVEHGIFAQNPICLRWHGTLLRNTVAQSEFL